MPRLLVPLFLAFATAAGSAQDTAPEDGSAPLGAPAAFGFDAPTETRHLDAGTRVYELPDPRTGILAVVDVPVDVEVVEREGAWIRVVYGARKGWVRDATVASDADAEPTPLAAPELDAERLEVARHLLGEPVEAALGPYRLLTDVGGRRGDARRIERLATVAAGAAEAYRERYGLDPGEPAGTVLLFARQETYRAYEEATGLSSDGRIAGHAGHGLIAMFADKNPDDDLVEVLLHELTHLMNRRALGEGLPLWLEEGTAGDLGFCRVDAEGRILLGSLGGEKFVRQRGNVIEVERTGPLSALDLLAGRLRLMRAPSLAELVDMPWQVFIEGDRELHYAESAFFVRFLLDEREGSYRDGFRGFLADIARGEKAELQTLLRHVGSDGGELQRRFEIWVAGLAAGF